MGKKQGIESLFTSKEWQQIKAIGPDVIQQHFENKERQESMLADVKNTAVANMPLGEIRHIQVVTIPDAEGHSSDFLKVDDQLRQAFTTMGKVDASITESADEQGDGDERAAALVVMDDEDAARGVGEQGERAERAHMENQQHHLNNPFYKDAVEYWLKTQNGQILKGAAKYREPFNPESWTAKELADHAMQENVDQAHYIYGLLQKLEAAERKADSAEVERLNAMHELSRQQGMYNKALDDIEYLTQERNEWRKRAEGQAQ